jgi:hypothetical protein
MAEDKEPLLSLSQAARAIGVNKSTISRQIRDGQIRSQDGKVKLSELRVDRKNNLRHADPEPTFARARAVKETYLAQLRRLEYQVKTGALIKTDLVQSRVFELARKERDALANWPSRVSPLIAAEIGCDQVALAVALEKHVREFLAERSADPIVRLAG